MCLYACVQNLNTIGGVQKPLKMRVFRCDQRRNAENIIKISENFQGFSLGSKSLTRIRIREFLKFDFFAIEPVK